MIVGWRGWQGKCVQVRGDGSGGAEREGGPDLFCVAGALSGPGLFFDAGGALGGLVGLARLDGRGSFEERWSLDGCGRVAGREGFGW